MPAPTSISDLIELARKSGVVDVPRLEGHVQKLRDANELPTEPAKLAAELVQAGVLTNFQSEQLIQGKWKRFTIGKYKVLERLGSGGMGSVFLCEHKFMRRRVAVKVLPSAKAADPSSLERFYREARAVAALDHPNIVHAYDIDQDETLHFLVMEYVDGPSLQEIVRRGGPLSVERASHYVSQAAQGLDHANSSGLVHRDIKPGNILVDSTGVVKILDMGLARFFNDEEDMLTRKYDENVLGTADYLAPEQADDSHTVDIRADIYGLGGTFYFMLTGKTPFGEGTIAQKLMWHRTRQPKLLSTFRDDVPAELQAVLNKMMAKEPDQRYQLPTEIATALTPWTQNVIAPPPEIEMPRLSPAASGPASSEPGSAAKKSWLVSNGGTPKAAANGNGNVVIAPTIKLTGNIAADMKRKAQPTGVTPRPGNVKPIRSNGVAEDNGSQWTAGGPETTNGTTKDDTPPQMPTLRAMFQSQGLRARLKLANLPRWVRATGVIIGAVILVVLIALAANILFRSSQALTVGKTGQFSSVKAALEYARSGDSIVLMDQEHRECLAWDAVKLSEIKILAADGIEVTWMPFADAGSEAPLMRLNNAKGFQVKGLRFDGEGRSRVLLWLGGNSPGLRVENVRLEGFTKSAVVISNCTGTSAGPVQLLGLKTSTGGLEADSAITFDALEALLPPTNEHIVVKNSKLDGAFSYGSIWFKKERSSTIVVQ